MIHPGVQPRRAITADVHVAGSGHVGQLVKGRPIVGEPFVDSK